jgi:hypothetical protein
VQTTWAAWVQEHPTTDVLKKDKEINSSRYASYFADPERTGIFRAEWLQDRLPGKTKINGITHGPYALAITEAKLQEGEPLNLSLANSPLVVYRAPDGGVRVYLAQAKDTVLTFQQDPAAKVIHDQQTHSSWDLTTGNCTQGKLTGVILESVPVMTAYWFAWSSFYPNTEVVD